MQERNGLIQKLLILQMLFQDELLTVLLLLSDQYRVYSWLKVMQVDGCL